MKTKFDRTLDAILSPPEKKPRPAWQLVVVAVPVAALAGIVITRLLAVAAGWPWGAEGVSVTASVIGGLAAFGAFSVIVIPRIE